MTSKIIVNNIQSDTGISTITISSPIALSGGVTGGGFAVGTGASIGSPATNVLTVSTNNVERIRVGAAGSIGIGTDNPTKLIDMSGVHSGINTTGRFVMSPHASGWDTGVTSGNIHHHYIDNFRIYSGQIGSGTERFKVDSSGRVTMPYQPGFESVLTSTSGSVQYTSINSEIVFNSTNSNVGNHYNTSTGRFTAPVTGNYMFYMFGMTTATTWYNFRKNGSPVTYPTHPYSISGTGSDWAQSSGMTIISLNVGDYVSVFTGGAGSGIYGGGNNHNVFVGYLLG